MTQPLKRRLGEFYALRLKPRLRNAGHWLVARVALAIFALLRRMPPDRAIGFAERAGRRLGPWFGRHRTALDNLRHAFPEKSEAQRKTIALDMWGNMARLAAEYVFLDQLFDFNLANPKNGHVEIEGVERFLAIAAEKRPHIIFTAHLGNFELLPIAAATYGLEVTALFRPPNNPYIADYILSTRRGRMGGLLASRAGALFSLSKVLEGGGNIGALVDQKFTDGVVTDFFGRPCESNPLVPMLARRFDCDVYPAHCIRLPGNRFRLIVGDRLDLPRTAEGHVDVRASTQLIASIVEGWVRGTPGQWMWFHKRWKRTPPHRSKHNRRNRPRNAVS